MKNHKMVALHKMYKARKKPKAHSRHKTNYG